MSNLFRKIILIGIGSFLTLSIASAKPYTDSDDPCVDAEIEAKKGYETCVGGELYGAYHSTTVEDGDAGHNSSFMDYGAYLYFRGVAPEANGWQASGLVELDLLSDGTTENAEAYVTVARGILTLSAGLINIGDIGVGNEFTTETGQANDGIYGNNDEAQPYFAVALIPMDGLELTAAYSTRTEDISFEASEDEGDVTAINLVGTLEGENYVFGVEYEMKSFQDNDQNVREETDNNDNPIEVDNTVLDSETFLGVALSYTLLDQFAPFLNYGTTSINDEAEEGESINGTELNIGIDLALTEELGVTLAIEQFSNDGKQDNGDDTENILNSYISIANQLGEATIIASYWTSNQKVEDGNDNLSAQFDLELAFSF